MLTFPLHLPGCPVWLWPRCSLKVPKGCESARDQPQGEGIHEDLRVQPSGFCPSGASPALAPQSLGRKKGIGGCSSTGREGKCFDSPSLGFCHRLEILDFKAKCQRATRSRGIFFGKCQSQALAEGNVSLPLSPQPGASPLLAVPPEGAGEGQGEG